MEEMMRNEIMEAMQTVLDKEQMFMLGNVICKVLVNYNIQKKSNEVGFCDDINDRLKKRFIASMRLEGKSEETIEQYAMSIDLMLRDINKKIPDINTNDIRYHLSEYQRTGVKNSTVDNRRRNLSSFFSWLAKEEIIIKSPMIRIAKIKSEVEVKLPFSDDDIEKMRCATMETRNSKRDRALIEFMLTTGCRVSEIVSLDISHVNFLREEAIVKGKGNKERKVYISRTAMHYLQEYISDREINADSPLFANKSGKRWSKQSIEKLIKSIAKKVEVDNAHPHRFRRTFATNALNKGMSVQCLQKILGHQSLDVTMRYCTVDDDTARIEHRRVA